MVGHSHKIKQTHFALKVLGWHHNSDTIFRQVRRCMGLKCQIFRVRSILWAFVIPELILLFTTQGWSPQQYSIYFASNRVLFDAKKSAGLWKKHYSWITFFLVEKGTLSKVSEELERISRGSDYRWKKWIREISSNLETFLCSQKKRSQRNISWEIFFFEKTVDIHLFKGFDQENLAMAHSLAKAMRRPVPGSLKNLN